MIPRLFAILAQRGIVVIVAVMLMVIGVWHFRSSIKTMLIGNWYTRHQWRADAYFKDPRVVALCHAIEANDLDEIERLITSGADPRARGKGNMTPLLWAFPENHVERFKLLLQRGADPNVFVTSSFNTKQIYVGDSVTHLAAGTAFPGYFEAVMENGGEPNLISKRNGESLLHAVIQSKRADKKSRVLTLLQKKANPNVLCMSDVTPAMLAVSFFSQYELAILLLDAGADPRVYCNMLNQKLVHFVARQEDLSGIWTPEQKISHAKLVDMLERRGESLADARKDLDRWGQWASAYGPAKAVELTRKEVQDRKDRQQGAIPVPQG